MSISPDPAAADPLSVTLDTQRLKRQSIRGSLVTVASQAAKMLIQLGSQLVLARLLFPADFGLIAIVSPVIGFILVFNDIGLGQAIVQRPILVQEQVSSLFWINIILSFVLAFAVALVSPLVGWFYGEPRVFSLMLAFGVLIPVAALGINPTALLLRQMRFGVIARNDVVATLVGAVMSILCAWRGYSYWSIVAGQFAGMVTGNTLSWLKCGWWPSRPRLTRAVWPDLKFGGNITGANLATFVTTSADNVIVGMMTGLVALGLYDRSYRLVVAPLGQTLAPLSRIALPLLSRLMHEPNSYRSAYLKMFRAILMTTVPGMLVCITHGESVVLLLLGNRWGNAAPIFSWICFGGLTSGIYSSASWLFSSQNRTQELRQFTTIASIINLASFFIGAFFWGIVGVAAAGATGFVLVTTPLMLHGATRSGPVDGRTVMNCCASFGLREFPVYIILLAMNQFFVGTLFTHVALAILVSYGASIGLSLMNPAERLLMEDAIGMVSSLRRRSGRSPLV